MNQFIGPRIERNLSFLKSVARTRSEKRRWSVLERATSDELLSLVEISYNILKSRFNLSKRQREKLFPHVQFVRKLGRARSEKGARRVIQYGKGIAFSSLLVPVIAELIRVIKSRTDGE